MEDNNKQSFGQLLEEHFTALPAVGDLVKGNIISIDNGVVRVDINGVTTGVVRGQELFSESDEYANLKVGDEVEATVVEAENETGEMELSFRVAGNQRVWDRMDKLIKDGVAVKAKVLQANKGGLMVRVGALIGFLPVSQLKPDHYPRVQGGDKSRILEHLKQIIGQDLEVKVIDADQHEEKLILSEKAVWEDEQKTVLDSYKIGDMVEGEVSALTSFGAFIRFGQGLEGLVHISEIVWQRIDHPKDVLKIGDKVKAQIIDLNKSKIYLSIKRLVDDPWKEVKDKYKIGQIVEGKIHKIEPFGLMVKLDEDIHGLAHISELADRPLHGVEDLRNKFKIGETYKFEIATIEPAEHRLGLKVEGAGPGPDEKIDVSVEEAKEEKIAAKRKSKGKKEKIETEEEKKEEKTKKTDEKKSADKPKKEKKIEEDSSEEEKAN